MTDRGAIAHRTGGQTSRRVLGSTFSAFALQNLSIPFSIASSIYLLRSLHVEQYGTLAILLGINLYLSVFSHLGVTTAIVRYVPEYLTQGNYTGIRRLVQWSVILRFVALAAVVAPSLLLIGPIAKLLNTPDLPTHFPLFCLYVALDVGVQLASAVLEGFLLQIFLNAARFGHVVAKLGLFVLLIRPGSELFGAIMSLILGNLGLLALLSFLAWRAVRGGHGGTWGPGETQRITRYALPWYAGKLSFLIFDVSTDVYLISFFLGPAATGLYSFAYNAASQLVQLMPSTFLWSSLVPATVRAARKDPDLLGFVFRFVNKLVAFSMVPLLAGASLLSDRIIAFVFGERYLAAALVFVGWTIVLCLRELEEPVRILLIVDEKARRLFVNRVLVLYNLGMALLLIPRLGIVGAILATGTTAGLGLLVTVFAARGSRPAGYPWAAFSRLFLNGLLLVVLILLARPLLVNLPRLVLGSALLGAGYMVVSLLNSPFDRAEIDFLGRALPPRATRVLAWLAQHA